MSRVQLALNVGDLAASIEFYGALFGSRPHKVRPGYANFEIADPPLKLVLIESPDSGTLNHLGVEVADTAAVREATSRLSAEGLATQVEDATVCCYARQDKVWVHDPAGTPWEFYTITDDDPVATVGAGCCSG
jgi:catechol 2,3-dioxygenase-like lactoylglutathione lyase family enzyme